MKYVEEELNIVDFAEKFLGINDFSSPEVYDMRNMDIEILGQNENGETVYSPINTFVVKPGVDEYYTDGTLLGTSNHTIIENDREIELKDNTDFHKVEEKMSVVDFEIENTHNYYANGRLNHNTTSGGKALPYHASTRIRLSNLGQIKDKDKTVIGMKTRCKILKNRLGPPLRSADFHLYFESGIDDLGSWIETLKSHNIISNAGAWYTYEMLDKTTGELVPIKFQSKTFKEILSKTAGLKEMLYQELCDVSILKYQKTPPPIDEVTVDTSDPEGIFDIQDDEE